MSKKKTHETIYRKDYLPPSYLVDRIDIEFDLGEEITRVRSNLAMRRNALHKDDAAPLVLYGRELKLKLLRLDDNHLTDQDYTVDDECLTIPGVADTFTLEIITEIKPQENSSLEGLYKSSGIFCTQCEAEGFRKISYYPDRPDVLAKFTTTIIADKVKYPVLLSNGNLIEQGDLEGGRHFARWEDPFRKPSYLFALVAGDLVKIEDSYTTCSGREVALQIFVEERNKDKCDHAMASLKKSMKWDEETFGLEYDLDIYMILAVDDFNMGAMENKGLNIFNSKYVLAKPETATDTDFEAIEEVIGHEYFHNWTGNRVTCRDWFQLSLKEGLTVFRDQEFSAHMTSRAVKRIQDVRVLRNAQFPEDGGPMAHSVRPDSYVEINNFYTTTVYNKGAEVIRMMHTLLGKEGFRKGMDLYFNRHDGQAVTCDDFVAAMEDASGIPLAQFRLWYRQAGTPELHLEDDYDEEAGVYTLKVRQSCPPTPGQDKKLPFHIPLAMGLLDRQGKDRPLRLEGDKVQDEGGVQLINLHSTEETFRFTGIFHRPIPSLLRNFSAPVKLRYDYRDSDLAFLMAHDGDAFNRWEAGQQLGLRLMLRLIEAIQKGTDLSMDSLFVDAFRLTLNDEGMDKALIAQALILPTETYIAEQMDLIDPLAIRKVREFIRKAIAQSLRKDLLNVYNANMDDGPYTIDSAAVGRRSLKNLCLSYLMMLEEADIISNCMTQFSTANNMTDVIAALGAFNNYGGPEKEETMGVFYDKWKKDPLVIDKWFSLQAISTLPGTFGEVKKLMNHPDFNMKNPNRVRSLIGVFCHGNMAAFHDESGEGYGFLADQVLTLDKFNPQVAARLVGTLSRWKRYDEKRQVLMKGQLERIKATDGLSNDVHEIVTKSLV
ncbi:MAG: aminopeptidase N [Proteobacteria bacterium]|nr:aminopeptidase N [Pseudomonadota bacterium]